MKLHIWINTFVLNCINIIYLITVVGSSFSSEKSSLDAKIEPSKVPLANFRALKGTQLVPPFRYTVSKAYATQRTPVTVQHNLQQHQQQYLQQQNQREQQSLKFQQHQQQIHHRQKSKRETSQSSNRPSHLFPTTTKLKRVTMFEEDANDDYDEVYDLNRDEVESTTTYNSPPQRPKGEHLTLQESLVVGGDPETDCHLTLSPSDIRWKKGSTLLIAFLPHLDPNTCSPPLRCSVSTTIHRHVSLQEGDSLQVVLQKAPQQPPSTTSTAPQLHHDFPEEGVKGNASENKLKKEISTNSETSALASERKNQGNSTHLFSREEHHLKFSSERLDVTHQQDGLTVLQAQPQQKLQRKRQVYEAHNSNMTVMGSTLINKTDMLGFVNGLEESYSFTVWKVTKSEWASCSTREGGQVAKSSKDGKANIGQDILSIGTHYFIGRSSWSSSECFKLKVSVRGADCGEGSICSGKGICFTNATMEEYDCGCCQGYGGKHCEERDACIREPCLNAGICLDIQEGHDGETFQCLCPYGFRGKFCETPSSLCDSNPCQNGGLCEGNHTYYTCHCASGWTGTHCLEKIDTIYSTEEQRFDASSHYDDDSGRTDLTGGCANGPCIHGVCVETTAQDFRCFCQPGFGGERCEMEYDECFSNPCPNGGTCVDQIGSYQCLCGPGYTGPNCLTKVNMCVPDPCPPNRVCKDKGNSFSCDCVPGLSDDDCGIRDQVCSPNPCVHGGTCYTIAETLSFYCACRPGFTGQTCQGMDRYHAHPNGVGLEGPHSLFGENNDFRSRDASILESVGPYGTGEPVEDLDLHRHTSLANPFSHLKNVYTGAITLACALIIFLLVVSICHCRVNRPYTKCCYIPVKRPRFFSPFGMSRSNSLREKLRRERTSVRLECDTDGASTSMTSPSNSDSVFYNMDVCDNQELPLIK